MTYDDEKTIGAVRAKKAFGQLKRAALPSVKKPQAVEKVATTLEQSKEFSRGVRARASSVVERSNLSTRLPNLNDKSISEWLPTVPQGLLATELSKRLNDMLGEMVKGTPTKYDKALDHVYNNISNTGGNNHRMFDGSHTILGAFKAVEASKAAQEASPDDSTMREAIGTLQALFRDAVTPKGLPLANWDPESYKQVADFLDSNFHIPKGWFQDINSYDAAEVLGATIGVVTVVLAWNRADTEDFSKIVGSMGLLAVMNANPLLLIITVVALARAFHKARHTGEYAEFADGQMKGAVIAGASAATSLLVVALMGASAHTLVVLIAGVTVGLLASKATQNVSFVEIGKFVSVATVEIAAEAKQNAAQHQLSQSVTAKATAASANALDFINDTKDQVGRVTLRGKKDSGSQ